MPCDNKTETRQGFKSNIMTISQGFGTINLHELSRLAMGLRILMENSLSGVNHSLPCFLQSFYFMEKEQNNYLKYSHLLVWPVFCVSFHDQSLVQYL